MTTVCNACGATVDADNFCTSCGTALAHGVQLSTPANIPTDSSSGTSLDLTNAVRVAAERELGSPSQIGPPPPSTASRVWDGVERVGGAVTTVFSVIVGLGWVLFGIIVFVALANGHGDGWLWLVGLGMIVYGIFLIMPTRGTKIIIY